MASQNLNVGTAANANDGDTLRAAFINVRKMFHEIYGISATYADDLDLSTGGETFAESVQDIIGGMVSGNTEDNIQVTYDDTNNKLNFTVAADITDVNAGAGLSGVNEDGENGQPTLSLDLNNLTAATVNVANDSIAIIDASDSNASRKESIADLMSAVAGTGITAANGVLNVSVDTDQIEGDAVTPPKLDQFDDSLTAATSGDILVSNGIDFIHATMSGDATIASGGALTIGNDKITEAKLGAEFTTTAAIAASAVDFSSAAVFTKTISSATTLTFSNVTTGAVKTLVISGDATLTLTGVTTLNGTYSGTASKNVIQIISTNGSSEMFATISNVT